MRARDTERQPDRQRGQGLVEFALVLPLILLLVVSVAELGVAIGNTHTLGYGSREGARVGSALARGEGCTDLTGDPTGVDAILVSAIQRILKTPDSGIDVSKVQQIRIFKATSTGAVDSGLVNVWTYKGPLLGAEVEDAFKIDFDQDSVLWPACARHNGGVNGYDSLGVTVTYRYDFITPFGAVLNAIAGGNLSLTLSETTVMALNPTM